MLLSFLFSPPTCGGAKFEVLLSRGESIALVDFLCLKTKDQEIREQIHIFHYCILKSLLISSGRRGKDMHDISFNNSIVCSILFP